MSLYTTPDKTKNKHTRTHFQHVSDQPRSFLCMTLQKLKLKSHYTVIPRSGVCDINKSSQQSTKTAKCSQRGTHYKTWLRLKYIAFLFLGMYESQSRNCIALNNVLRTLDMYSYFTLPNLITCIQMFSIND